MGNGDFGWEVENPDKGEENSDAEPEREDVPQIKLTEISKSPKAVIDKTTLAGVGKVLFCRQGDYFIVSGAGKERLKVFTKQGNRIESFSGLDGEGRYTYNRELADAIGLRGELLSDAIKNVSWLSRPFIQKMQEATGETYTNNFVYRLIKQPLLSYNDVALEVTQSPGYLILFDRSRMGVIAFKTTNEQGVEISPQEWQRIDSLSPVGDIKDPKFKELIEGVLSSPSSSIGLNDQHRAKVSEDALEIVPQDRLERAIFHFAVDKVGKNVCTDPANDKIVYFCQGTSASEIYRLDLSAEPSTWQVTSAKFPDGKNYPNITGLKLDPSGSFFYFSSGKTLIFVDKTTLQEVGRTEKLREAQVEADGKLYALDDDGFIVTFDTNLGSYKQIAAQHRAAALTQGLDPNAIFQRANASIGTSPEESRQELDLLVKRNQDMFETECASCTQMSDIARVRAGMESVRTFLTGQGLSREDTEYVIRQIEPTVQAKESELAQTAATDLLSKVQGKLGGEFSMTTIDSLRADLESLTSIKAMVGPELGRQIADTYDQFNTKVTELFKQNEEVVAGQIEGLLKGAEEELNGMTSREQFDTWIEYSRPQYRSRLGLLLANCPLENVDMRKRVTDSLQGLEDLSQRFERKFEIEYAKVREAAAEVKDQRVKGIEGYSDSLIKRMARKGFKRRADAEAYLSHSEDHRMIQEQIASIKASDPDAGKELEMAFRVTVANFLAEVDRGALTTVTETGQQMIMFGDTPFPRWEAKIKERGQREVDLTFIHDSATRGPGVSADKVLGDLGITIKTSEGKVVRVRLYEGEDREEDWRFGGEKLFGEDNFAHPSYVEQGEYRKIKADYLDWARTDSPLRAQTGELRKGLKKLFAERPAERGSEAEAQWKQRYIEKYNEFCKFSQDHHISLLRRIDRIKNTPEKDHINGEGYIPRWQSHWVIDTDTRQNLEDMAGLLKMQLDTHEGILNLVGHAGSGKDVLVKMFCNMVNRPYFAIDCSKWTTEFELSEDVVLEAEGGASRTVKVPSVVLNAITTPGAIMYFNEFNAMPEQAQIFLHGLLDEKRAMTLKTSSGRSINALPSVLFVSSMNPGYPGTFEPQFATRSRMVTQEIGYPSLFSERDPNDPNSNPPYNPSEALRAARGLDSLQDLTLDPNPENNEFIALWNHYINGIKNGAPEPTVSQKFDLDVVSALIQFGTRLRENFILTYEKSRDARNAISVKQPFTGRELRRCAYSLNQMSTDEKVKGNPEKTARDLISDFFLSHIDSHEEREAIRKALATWTSSKRVG